MNLTDSKTHRATLTTQIEDELRSEIVEGSIRPGTRLMASELANRYGVSATPLREALQRLAAQGLVVIDPRLGATVAELSLADLRDTYRVRELLESMAVRESVENGDAEWANRLSDSFAEFKVAVEKSRHLNGSPTVWSDAHRAFHEALMSACHSRWVGRLLEVISYHSERYRLLSAQTGDRNPVVEHRAILEAALANDSDRAVEACQRHLRRTLEVIEISDSLPS